MSEPMTATEVDVRQKYMRDVCAAFDMQIESEIALVAVRGVELGLPEGLAKALAEKIVLDAYNALALANWRGPR